MLFLLFIIGFEIDLKKMKKLAGFIIGTTFFTIIFSAITGALVIHYLFGYGWFISFIVGTSFATVGEAILLPILDKFKIVNTKLGQTILGVGTFDDIFEIAILVIIVLFIGAKSSETTGTHLIITFGALILLFILAAILIKLKKRSEQFNVYNIETLFLISLAVLFLFLGIGGFANSTALAALLAGISLKTFLPKGRRKNIENEMRSLCYGFFAPIFFLSAGLALNIDYLIFSPLLVLAVFFVAGFSKIISSYIAGYKKMGKKNSILLGIGLSVRFSTSIVIIKILFDHSLIKEGLYSVIVASSILFTLIIPVLFSKLVSKWGTKQNG
jgi:Kef-type K+ transport system membrane component KefB